jgi:hypothetical protein
VEARLGASSCQRSTAEAIRLRYSASTGRITYPALCESNCRCRFYWYGGSVLVALTSFLTTKIITSRQLADAHSSRMRDKQASTYIDAITGIQWRTANRNRELAVIKMTGRNQAVHSDSPVDWTELQGRLFAFASPEVLVAMRAAGDAGTRADQRTTDLFALILYAVEPDEQWSRERNS